MVYSYYPGCTLKNKAQDLDRYARMSAEALGFTLEEIEAWQCCGAVYPLASDEIATKLSAVRALNDAKEKGQDLVTLCSACLGGAALNKQEERKITKGFSSLRACVY